MHLREIQNINIDSNHYTMPDHLSFRFKKSNAASRNRKQVVKVSMSMMKPQSHRLGSKICFKTPVVQDKLDYYGRNTENYSSNLFCPDASFMKLALLRFKDLFSLPVPSLPFPSLPSLSSPFPSFPK